VRRSPLLDLHRAAGARLPEVGESLRVLAFGDVPGEYRSAREGAALFDATGRGLVLARGPEAAAFLQRLLANRVRDLEPGSGNANMLLTPKGKVAALFDLARTEDELFQLSTEPGQAAALVRLLDVYHFGEKLELVDASEEHAPLEVCGPRAAEVLRAALGVEPPRHDHATSPGILLSEPVRVTALPVAGSAGWRVDAGPDLARALWESLVEHGARPAGLVARESLRVEAGEARWGEDVDENVYPQEARLERAFSLEKGCYVGQEVVAKIDTYGGLNKRLVCLRPSHDDPLPRGTRLMVDQDGGARELGLITSWAWSFELDGGLALGYAKRRHQEPGTTFRLGDGPATATVVPLPVRADALAPPVGAG
jgi:folate-binding protein YgfZ